MRANERLRRAEHHRCGLVDGRDVEIDIRVKILAQKCLISCTSRWRKLVRESSIRAQRHLRYTPKTHLMPSGGKDSSHARTEQNSLRL